jgi:hypothetical protein
MTVACLTCKREFKFPWMLKRHSYRKTPCSQPNDIKNSVIKLNNIQNISKIYPIENNKHNIILNEIIKCDYCNKQFKHNSNLYRHKNELRCKAIPLSKKKQIMTNCNNKTINNINNINNTNNGTINNNNNNNININLNAFGKESLDNITEKEILKILNKAYMAIPLALKTIHFDKIENRNLFQPNKNKQYVSVYDGKDWVYKKIESVSDTVSNNMSVILEEWFEEYKTKLKKSKQNTIQNMLEDYNNGNLEERFNEDFKLFLMSYSTKIKEMVNKEIDKLILDQ